MAVENLDNRGGELVTLVNTLETDLNTAEAAIDVLEAERDTMSAGTGISTGTGTIHKTRVLNTADVFETVIAIDLTGLRSTAAGDIIGVDGTSLDCHIGQITAAKNGTILYGTVTCLEAPAGGDPDIDLYSATESTGSEDDAISGLTETQLMNSGAHTIGKVTTLTAVPAAGEYLYLVAQATTDADYTAGKFEIRLIGT